MPNSIYFASTILHLYAAAVIAAERPNEQAHLIFMDQPEGKPYPLFDIVKDWPESPFVSVRLFYGRFPGLLNKLKKRKLLFQQLQQVVTQLRPTNIFVGNDRRIEFQFSMNVATELGCNPIGHYMDEGTFTYIGRKASSGFADAVFDNAVKKLSYGNWWKNPPTVGGSDWITHVHVAFSEQIHPLLRDKKVHPLNAAGFTSPAMLSLSSAIMAYYGFDPASLRQIDVLFTLPHESLFEKNPDYRQQVLSYIQRLSAEGKHVAAKYHPRNSGPDILQLAKDGVQLLPADISFEAMLPHLPALCAIWGDVSSTLLIAKWLRQELAVYSMPSTGTSEFGELFRALGIQPVRSTASD
ncbi:polysialyltransferase family glycosyltransferase [Parathalassolituus penaei]|uniref:Polysialyltransferase family glycosyltransferase n=1 Tax=Parathalassolituus penaei TaxID=2997323 RepID=A0A9X3EF05_9GAMM|nr:polysialyltransferase family glycosyltransferase [Parathalassolituus penaei]MCY0966362.1 polysialyltransferase family glycosyltransferase [Parathalassolituus penaei]